METFWTQLLFVVRNLAFEIRFPARGWKLGNLRVDLPFNRHDRTFERCFPARGWKHALDCAIFLPLVSRLLKYVSPQGDGNSGRRRRASLVRLPSALLISFPARGWKL
jgi:hypothetical protein